MPSKQKSPVYVLGVGMTKFIKPRGKVDYTELGFEAGVKALLDAQITYDDVDQGVACVDVDTGIAVGQRGGRLIRHEKCRGVCNNCWDFGGTPCILR